MMTTTHGKGQLQMKKPMKKFTDTELGLKNENQTLKNISTFIKSSQSK